MIQIIHGVYGYLDKDGIVRPKTEADAPFELSPDQEARLVRLGIAQYVASVNHAQESADLTQEVGDIDIDETFEEEVPLSDYNVKELREIGKEYGLTFKVGASKADMVKAIEEAKAALTVEAEEDGESAPVFDASEAVQ